MARAASADEDVLKLLSAGCQVLFIRQASTVSGMGDPAAFRLADCATQRNLSAEGREEARRLGRFLEAQKSDQFRIAGRISPR